MARFEHLTRAVAGLFVAVLFIVVLPATVTVVHADQTESISVWHSYRGAEQQALVELTETWNEANPNRPVRLLNVPHEAYANRITTAVPRGQGPDLFISAHERIGDWANSDIIDAVDDDFSDDEFAEFLPDTVDALRYEDRTYGIPLAYKTVALFYNRELVDEPPQTTDELLKVAASLTDAGKDRYGLAYQADDFYFHSGWFYGFGGRIFDDSGQPRLNRPENIDSFAFVADLRQQGLLPDEPTGALVAELFNRGDAAMVIQGQWFIGEIDEGVDYGVAQLPKISETNRHAEPFMTVEAALVAAGADNREGAIDFARFLASEDAARTRLETGHQMVANSALYEDDSIDLPEALVAFQKQAEHTSPMPNEPLMRSVWEPAAFAMRTVVRGSATPQTALDNAQVRLDAITRPAPEATDPMPFIIGGLMLLVMLLFWFGIRLKRHGGIGHLREKKEAYLYLLPGAVALLVLLFVPFLVGTGVAFFSHQDGEFSFVGLAHFFNIIFSEDYALSDPLSFYFTLVVTVMWTALNVALHVTIGLALAMLLRDPWLKLKGVYRVLLIVPWAIPSYITALIWRGMFHSQFGAINGLLTSLGLEPVPWFSDFWTAFAANVATNTWLGFPFMMVVCLGALQAVPKELEEAAMMDGANSWTRFRKIILPQIKPALVPAVVLGSVWTFNMFNVIYLVSGGEPDGSTEILISEAYKWAFARQEQYGYAAAYATLIFIVLIGYSALTKRVTDGGKGGPI